MVPKLNVLLTGASGTVGIEVLQQLADQEAYHVTLFDKKTARSTKMFAPYKNSVNIIIDVAGILVWVGIDSVADVHVNGAL